MDGTERARLIGEAKRFWQAGVVFSHDMPDQELQRLEAQLIRWCEACDIDDGFMSRKGAPLTAFVAARLEEVKKEVGARDHADATHFARENLAVDRESMRLAKEGNRKAMVSNWIAGISLLVSLIALYFALR